METRAHAVIKLRKPIFRTEDDVDDHKAQGLGHGETAEMVLILAGLKRAVGPSGLLSGLFLGRCPRLI
jgi:hypothetical protein